MHRNKNTALTPRWHSLTAALIILIDYLTQNLYRFVEVAIVRQPSATYAFDAKWMLFDMLYLLIAWLIMYLAINSSLQKGILIINTKRHLLIFSILLFAVRSSIGHFLFLFIYYGVGMLLFDRDNLPGIPTGIGSGLFLQTISGLSAYVSFIIARKLFSFFQRKLKPEEREISFHESHNTRIFLFALSMALASAICLYLAAASIDFPISIQTDLGIRLGALIDGNVFIIMYLLIPVCYALVAARKLNLNLGNSRLILAGLMLGTLCFICSVSLTYIVMGLVRFSTTLLSMIIYTILYQVCFLCLILTLRLLKK